MDQPLQPLRTRGLRKYEDWDDAGRNKDLTKAKKGRNNPARYYGYTRFGGRPMIAIAAAGAFVGLFALWVVLPKKLMRK